MTRVSESTEAKYDRGLRASYDKEAEQYDRLRYESTEGRLFNDLELELLRAWVALHKNIRVLDLPTGTGRLSVALAGSAASIIGGDLSQGMLRVAAAKASDNQLTNVNFLQASGTQLPFGDATFDTIISFKFFHLITNDLKPVFIREMARVLKPGGSIIVEFNSPFYGGVLAFVRYYFQKKQPGGMRMKCLFPDQLSSLFEGLQVTRTQGIKLPLAGRLQALIGARRVSVLNDWFGQIPGLKYFLYAIVVEARKPV